MPPCKIRHRFLQTVQILLVLIIISSLLNWTDLAAEESNNPISIEGQVRVPQGVSFSEGLDVVLIKFVLDPSGEVVPAGPVERIKTDDIGRFRFENPPRDDQAGYRLGTRFEGNLYSSEVFFMRPEKQLINVDIRLPSTSFDTSTLVFSESSLFLESNIDQLIVTEVISIQNPTEDNILSTQSPLLMELPNAHENFSVLEDGPETYQQKGTQLRWTRGFPPGDTQLLFQYTIPVFLGSHLLQKRYAHPLDRVSIFTPAKRLDVSSSQLTFQGNQTFGDVDFLAWRAQASDASLLEIRISDIPVDSRNYAFVSLAVFLTLLLAVGWFFWRRMPGTGLVQK